jgi:hypothetical protein
MNERMICAMSMLTRAGKPPYDAKFAALVWGVARPIARRWLKEFMRDVGVLLVVESVGGKDMSYRPSKMWRDAVADATEQGEVLGRCPGCGKEAIDLVRWYKPETDPGAGDDKWGYWCGECMTVEDTDTDCPRCYYGMTVTDMTTADEAAVGLVYLKAICRRCKLRIDAAGVGMADARHDIDTAKRRRAWEWITLGPAQRRAPIAGPTEKELPCE